MPRPRVLMLLYFLVSVADLWLIYSQHAYARWFTKPLLMPLLLTIVWMSKSNIPLYKWMLAGLSLSWAGDVLLQLKGMFIPGLASFLAAHIWYIIYFIKINPAQTGLLKKEPLIGLPVLVYILIFLWQLYPFLDTLRMPVTAYAITIGCMLLMSIHAQHKVNKTASVLFFNGALQFVISDSLLAVNLFAFSHTVLSICVMATFAGAQYLLVKGSLAVQNTAS